MTLSGFWPAARASASQQAERGVVSADLLWQAYDALAILHPVPAQENSIQLYQASLTTREQRELARAERTIGKGLKSFLAVGMALKEIRDNRLYRQQYDTFEEYVAKRWELSRPRAYALCAASEVVAFLSPIGDTGMLPENEAQARPLTRLKATEDRQRAWKMAVDMAAAEERPVTARDTEEAVQRLNGNGRSQVASVDVVRSACESQDEILRGIQQLHCKSGYELDATYGNGSFWETLPRPKLCFDLIPTESFVKAGDFRHLPLGASSIKSMVLDPPFLTYMKPSKMGIMNGRFSGYWTYQKLLADYSAAISEAFRILKPGGIFVFKVQDCVHNHALQATHCRVWLLAEKKGFRLKDLFVLVAPNRLPVLAASHGRQTPRHARVFHCYFLVFQKR
ncbi:MAG: hypothetical protein ACLQU3_03470 [Limisphaerales bacterium]